jgi:hypothetical protein
VRRWFGDAIGDRDGLGGVHRDVLGVAALATAEPADALPLGKVGDTLPDGDHLARALDTRDERRRHRAGSLVDVHVVHAGRASADQHLAGARGRPFALDRLEDVSVPRSGHRYRTHR